MFDITDVLFFFSHPDLHNCAFDSLDVEGVAMATVSHQTTIGKVISSVFYRLISGKISDVVQKKGRKGERKNRSRLMHRKAVVLTPFSPLHLFQHKGILSCLQDPFNTRAAANSQEDGGS